MKNPSISEKINRHAPLIIFVTGILLLFPSIWSEMSVTGQDEYWLSFRTPMETMARGDWLTPWVNGEPMLKKLPLLYWAIALSYKLLGINLIAARLWGVLSGAGLAVCSCIIARELFGKSGLLAGLMTLGTLGVVIQGRLALIDLPLAFFISLAVYLSLKWWKSGFWRYVLSAAFSLGAAFLLKGPIGFHFFAVAVVTGLIVFKGWSVLSSRLPQILVSAILILAVSLPWPVAMARMWPDYVKTVGGEWGARHFADFSFISPFSALGGALGLVFPWSLVLIAAVLHTLMHMRHSPDRKRLWLVLWYLCSSVPFFFIQTFERYMLPLIPPVCVLCCEWLEEVTDSIKVTLIQISMYMTAIVALLISLFSLWFGIGIVPAVISLTLVVLILWGAYQAGKLKPVYTFQRDQESTWRANLRPQKEHFPHNPSHYIHVSVACIAVLFAVIMGGLYPSLGINAMPSDLQGVLGDHSVAVYSSSQPSMLSMRLKRSVISLDPSDRSDTLSLGQFDGFVFMEDSDAAAFEKLASVTGLESKKAGQFKTFFSWKTWLRFARKDATVKDWKRAFKARSLEDLKSVIRFYRVYPKEARS